MINYFKLNKITVQPYWSWDNKDRNYYECFYYFNLEKIFKRMFITLNNFDNNQQYFIANYLSWKNNNNVMFYNNDYKKPFTCDVPLIILNTDFNITFSVQPHIHDVKLNKENIAFSEKDLEKILKIKLIESILD